MKLNINRKIRNGMWARDPDGIIGIATEMNFQTQTCEFHVVDENGETYTVVPGVGLATLQQADLADIPEPRRPSADVGARLGYR